MEVRLFIDNVEFDAFVGLDIYYDINACCNTANIILPYSEDFINLFSGFKYPLCRIECNNKIIFNGLIETVQSLTNNNHYLFQGRTFSYILTDPTTILNNYIYQNINIGNLLSTICNQYNLKVKMPAGNTDKIRLIQLTHNDSVYNQLMRYAGKTSIKNSITTITTDFNGDLVLGKNIANYSILPIIDFDENNTFDAKINLRGDLRYSKYIRYGQNIKDISIDTFVIDKYININKVNSSYSIGETLEELRNICSRDRAYDIMASSQIFISFKDWLDYDNNLLDVGKIVSLELPTKFIRNREKFIIEKLNFVFNKDGYYSIIKLTPDYTFDIG